jgi:hypothetical protein
MENMETRRHGQGDMETCTWIHGHRDIKRKMENGSPGDFPVSVYRLPIVQLKVCLYLRLHKQTEVIRLQTD